MNMNVEKKDGILLIQLHGEIMGGEESVNFQNYIFQAIEEENTKIIVDMANVKWMNSSGLGMLMGALTTLRSSGGEMYLINVSDRVRRPVEVTRLDSVLKMFSTFEEAAAGFMEGE